jgi:putative aldouronate transport system substrate-binding protein
MKKALVLTLSLLCLGPLVFGAARRQGSVPTVVWYLPSPGANAAQDLVDNTRIMSDYTEQQIGVRFELRDITGDVRRILVNSGEAFDIMFTQDFDDARNGVYADITDKVQTVTPALWNYVPQMLWDGVAINDKIYYVPAYKDTSVTVFIFWDKKYVDKYNLDTNKRPYTIQDFDRDLRIVKAGEGPNFYFYGLQWPDLWAYDAVGSNGMGVRMDDPNRRVVAILEQPDQVAKYKIIQKWFEDGIMHPDSPQLTVFPLGMTVQYDIAWPSKAQFTALGQGIEAYVPVDLNTPYISTGGIRGSLQGFGANSRNLDAALKLIEMVNTDHKLRDMLAFGIEGRNFRYVSPNVVERLNDNYMAMEWTQGTFFNLSTTTDQSATTWDEVRSQNERGVASTLLGFSFDPAPVRNEIANINTVYDRYRTELVYGGEDRDVLIARIMRELRAVGFDRVAAEAQRQIDEFFK